MILKKKACKWVEIAIATVTKHQILTYPKSLTCYSVYFKKKQNKPLQKKS